MLYGPQGIFGGLTPSQRAAHERRREAAERLAKAARPSESVTLPAASGGAKRTDDAPEADAFFKSAWRLLDASIAKAEKPTIGSWPVRKIQEGVCAYYQITMEDLTSPARTQDLARPRQVAMYLSRILTGRSLPEIGRRFGARRHTTVLHAVRQISARLQHDGRLGRDIDAITTSLKASDAPKT